MALANTGYQAPIANFAWSSGQGPNNLTDNEYTDLSDAVNNDTGRYVTVDIALDLGSAAFSGSDSVIEVYIVPSVDGTNYGTWGGNTTADQQQNNNHAVYSVTTSGTTAAQTDLIIRNVVVPPGNWRIGLRNRSNVTLAGSNTISYRPHSFEDV